MVITRYAIRFRTAVFVLMANLIIAGLISFQSMPREMTPDIEIPVVVVQVPYPGASPEDVEQLILTPVEKELKDLKDVNKLSGAAYEGAAVVTIEFDPAANIDESLQAVRDRVSRVRPKLPADIQDPTTQEVSFSDFPILIVNVSGDYSPERLKRFAKDLQEDIESKPGVLEARLAGGLEEQFRISVDPEAAQARGVDLGVIVRAIQSENVNLPGGLLEVDHTSYLLRTPADFRSEKQLREVAIKAPDGRAVMLYEVAKIERAFVKPTSYARINQRNCVSLQITKRTGANIITVVDSVKELVDSYALKAPNGTEMKLLQDQSVEIRRMVDDLVNNIVTSLVLVIAVIFFFMGARNAALVSLAVPLSMLLTFVTLDAMGVTLNMVTLFSLILALGMLVDNAIVIIENIYRHLGERVQPEDDGVTFRKARIVAAYTGTKEVAWPVIASTATTVAAFGPLLFWPGMMGKFMGYLPMVVIITLVSSLLVGLIMNPVTAAVFMKRPSGDRAPEATDDNWEDSFRGPLARLYGMTLRFAIDVKRKRVWQPLLVIVLAFGSLVGSIMAYGASDLGVEFFPETTPKRATVSVVAPNGTHLDGSDRIVRQVEHVIGRLDNVKDFVATPGAAASQFGPGGGGAANAHQSGVSIDFLKEEHRTESTIVTIEKMREAFAKIAGARIEVQKEKMGPPSGAPISVRVSGTDYAVLGRLSAQVMGILADMKDGGVADPKTNYVTGRPEMQVVVDRVAAREVGASTSAVAMAIRNAFNGNESSVIRDGNDEYDIVVRYTETRRQAPSDLASVRVPGKDGILIPLDQLARVVRTSGAGTIRHLDTDRVVTIDADVVPGANANKLRAELAKRLDAELRLPGGYAWTFGGENAEQEKAAAFLSRALMLGVFMILLILVTQFNSMLKPAIIISSVVLSLIGVFAGLVLTRMPFGVVMTGLGVISLAGVVVNNAIVLIDFIEQLQKAGLPMHEAVLRAGMTRLRPVLLTALTTVLGLVPMAMGWSVNFLEFKFESAGSSGEFWGGMAVAVIFGLLFATLLTLVVVPALYVVLERLGGASKRLFLGSEETVDLDEELKLSELSAARAPAQALLWLVGVGGALALVLTPTPALAQQAGATMILQAPKGQVKRYGLDDLLAKLKTSSPDLLAARERMKSAVLIVDRAWSALHPQITASGTYTLNDPVMELQFFDPEAARAQAQAQLEGHIQSLQVVRAQTAANGQSTSVLDQAIQQTTDAKNSMPLPASPDPVEINKRHGLSAKIMLQMSLYDARTFDGLKMARATARMAKRELSLTKVGLAHAVGRAYAGAVLQRESLGVLQRRLDAAKRELDAVTKRRAAGVGTPLGQRVAALRVIQTERAVAGARLAYHSAVASLGLIVGIDEQFEVVGTLNAERPTGDVKSLVHQARTRRPEVALLGEQRRLVNLRVGETRKRWLPRFSLVGQSQWSNAAGFGGQNVTSMLMVTVTQQIWDGGTSGIDRREMLSSRRQLELQRARQRVQIGAEVRGALARLANVEKDLSAARKAVEVSARAAKDAKAGYDAGTNTELELRAQEDQLVEAKLGVVQAEVQVQVAVLDLRQAVGLNVR